MTKVKVQDATKQLSTNAGMLFETVSRARKQAQDTYGALKKISDDLNRTEKQRLEMEAKEALRKQYEAAAARPAACRRRARTKAATAPGPVRRAAGNPCAALRGI